MINTLSMNLNQKKKKGFTLIELIVVIAIIAIIALIAIPKVMGYQDDSKKKADISNAKSIANAAAIEVTNGHITAPQNEFEIKGNGSENNPADYVVKGLQNVPKIQTKNKNTNFFVKIDANGAVIVLDGEKGNQIYPKPVEIAGNPYYE